MQSVVKVFPFIYGTSLFRKVMMMPLENTLFSGTPEIIRSEVDRTMGMDIFIYDNQLSQGGKIGILIAVGIVFIVVSTIFITLSKKKDR